MALQHMWAAASAATHMCLKRGRKKEIICLPDRLAYIMANGFIRIKRSYGQWRIICVPPC
jgi:hypothetical protein